MVSMRQKVIAGMFILSSAFFGRPNDAVGMTLPDKNPLSEHKADAPKDSAKAGRTAEFTAGVVNDEVFVQEQLKNGRTLKNRQIGFVVDTKDGLTFHPMDDLKGVSPADLERADSAVSYNFEQDVVQNIKNRKGKVIGTETYHVKENMILAHRRHTGKEDGTFTRDDLFYAQFQIRSPDGKVSSIVMNHTSLTGNGKNGSDPELLKGDNYWYAMRGPVMPNELAGAKTVVILMTKQQTLKGALPTIGLDPQYVVQNVIAPTVEDNSAAGVVAVPNFEGNGQKQKLVGVMANHSNVMVSRDNQPGM